MLSCFPNYFFKIGPSLFLTPPVPNPAVGEGGHGGHLAGSRDSAPHLAVQKLQLCWGQEALETGVQVVPTEHGQAGAAWAGGDAKAELPTWAPGRAAGRSPRVWSQVGLEWEGEPVPPCDLCRLWMCPLKLVSSASPLSVEVINFTQMEKLSCAPTPKGVCNGFLRMTNARGGGPTCCRSPTFCLLLPPPLRPTPLVSSVISHLWSLTSAQRGVGRGPRWQLLPRRSHRWYVHREDQGALWQWGHCTQVSAPWLGKRACLPVARAPYPRYLAVRQPDDAGLMPRTCRWAVGERLWWEWIVTAFG